MLNVVAIMGRLVADPELRTTPAGVNVCQFRIACIVTLPGRVSSGRLILWISWHGGRRLTLCASIFPRAV